MEITLHQFCNNISLIVFIKENTRQKVDQIISVPATHKRHHNNRSFSFHLICRYLNVTEPEMIWTVAKNYFNHKALLFTSKPFFILEDHKKNSLRLRQ